MERNLYRGEKIKGRTSIRQLANVINLLLRMNKIYIGLGVLLLVLVVGLGIYWQSRKVAIPPVEQEVAVEQEVTLEEKSFNEDTSELGAFNEDKSLDTLDEDLADIAEETVPVSRAKKIDIASVENLERELASELSSFSADISDLEGFESDASFGDLDTELSGI